MSRRCIPLRSTCSLKTLALQKYENLMILWLRSAKIACVRVCGGWNAFFNCVNRLWARGLYVGGGYGTVIAGWTGGATHGCMRVFLPERCGG